MVSVNVHAEVFPIASVTVQVISVSPVAPAPEPLGISTPDNVFTPVLTSNVTASVKLHSTDSTLQLSSKLTGSNSFPRTKYEQVPSSASLS